MTFCIILGTLLGVVSLLLGAQWCRRTACRGRWCVRPVRVPWGLGVGKMHLETLALCRPSRSWALRCVLSPTWTHDL